MLAESYTNGYMSARTFAGYYHWIDLRFPYNLILHYFEEFDVA